MDALSLQIDRAFAAEQSDATPVRTRDQLPRDYDAITDDWLTDVLCRNAPGARVVGHRLGPPDNGTNNRRRIHLAYNMAGAAAGLPASLFFKATHGLANRQMLAHSAGILCEVTFHRDARHLIDIEAPTARFAAYDQVGFNSIVMLYDLGPETHFCSEHTRVDRSFVEAQLALLARLHGRFYRAPELATVLAALPTWHQRFSNLASFHLQDSCIAGLEAAEAFVPARLFERRDEIWGATIRALDLIRDRNPTLCHGDVRLKDWYVAGDGTVGLGDWGVAHRRHWARDLSYTLATALTVADRRACERDLVAQYCDRLAEAGGERVEPDDAWLLYRQSLPTALAFWTLTLRPTADFPDMQPEATARVFVERLAMVVDDLDVLDAV